MKKKRPVIQKKRPVIHLLRFAGVVSLAAFVTTNAPERQASAQTTEDATNGTTTLQAPSTEGTTTEEAPAEDPAQEAPLEPPVENQPSSGGQSTQDDPSVEAPADEPATETGPDEEAPEEHADEAAGEQPPAAQSGGPILVPASALEAVLAEIGALGDDATPVELELAALLEAGEIEGVTALADYLVANDSLRLLGVLSTRCWRRASSPPRRRSFPSSSARA